VLGLFCLYSCWMLVLRQGTSALGIWARSAPGVPPPPSPVGSCTLRSIACSRSSFRCACRSLNAARSGNNRGTFRDNLGNVQGNIR
jgi:hypothetical protein